MNFHVYHLIDDFSPAYYGVTRVITDLASTVEKANL